MREYWWESIPKGNQLMIEANGLSFQSINSKM